MKYSLFIGLLIGLTIASSCDPYYNDQIAALGDEAPNVRKGPLHRPGQPCLLCHDGAQGSPPEFSVAGTVFVDPAATNLVPAVNATVLLRSATGRQYAATTNEAGNFYVSPNQFVPAHPMNVEVSYLTDKAVMHGHVGRDGSCAGCHTDPVTESAAGHVYVVGAPK